MVQLVIIIKHIILAHAYLDTPDSCVILRSMHVLVVHVKMEEYVKIYLMDHIDVPALTYTQDATVKLRLIHALIVLASIMAFACQMHHLCLVTLVLAYMDLQERGNYICQIVKFLNQLNNPIIVLIDVRHRLTSVSHLLVEITVYAQAYKMAIIVIA